MDQILDPIRDALEGEIDFQGQKLAEQLSTYLLIIVGVISFLAGYITQDLRYTLAAGAGGTLLTFLAVIPPWPFYNKNPAKWLPARDSLAGISVSQ